MASLRFTKASVAALRLKPGQKERIDFDAGLEGFGVRVRAAGASTWVAQYRHHGKTRRVTIGSVSRLDLDAARTRAREILAKADLGTDTQAEKRKARAQAGVTMGAHLDAYLDSKRVELRPSSLRATDRYLREDFGSLHALPIHEIDRAVVAAKLADIRKRAPVAADRARVALSTFFSWLIAEGIAPANPVIGVRRPADPNPRDRVLSPGELVEIWQATDKGGEKFNSDHNSIVRLLVLTGQRRDEIAALQWAEVDLDVAQIELPAARTKNKRPHIVPLSIQAIEALNSISARFKKEAIENGRQGDFPLRYFLEDGGVRFTPDDLRTNVFGEGETAFSGFSKAKRNLDARILKNRRIAAKGEGADPERVKPMPEWRIHDIRRTVATGMADIGIQPHVIEAVLNHVSGHKAGVAGIYNRSTYLTEKRQALARWGEHVAALVAGKSESNIVTLHPRSA